MLRIKIENMHCGGCAKGVRAALDRASPDAEVEVNLEHREVRVTCTDAPHLLTALKEAGWDAHLASD